MTGSWLLKILFFVYPLVVIIFNRIIRDCIHCKRTRKNFLLENEYVNKLFYLFMPLLVLHFEMMLLHEEYPFYEINIWIIGILVFLQSYVFFASVIGFYHFFRSLRKFGQQVRE